MFHRILIAFPMLRYVLQNNENGIGQSPSMNRQIAAIGPWRDCFPVRVFRAQRGPGEAY
jgi:hypothetical protein